MHRYQTMRMTPMYKRLIAIFIEINIFSLTSPNTLACPYFDEKTKFLSKFLLFSLGYRLFRMSAILAFLVASSAFKPFINEIKLTQINSFDFIWFHFLYTKPFTFIYLIDYIFIDYIINSFLLQLI